MFNALVNMNRKKLVGAFAIAMPLFVALTVCFRGNNEFSSNAAKNVYQAVLDKNQKITTSSSFVQSSMVVKSLTDGSFELNGSSVKDSGNYFTTLNANANLTTTTDVKGLTNIVIETETTANLVVRYGWTSASYSEPVTLTGTKMSFNFNDLGPSRFSITNESSKQLNIKSINVYYSCTATEAPKDVTYAYLTTGYEFNGAIGGASSVTFCSVDEAIQAGATKSGNRTFNGNASDLSAYNVKVGADIYLYKKGSNFYFAADAKQPCIIFNKNSTMMFGQASTLVDILVSKNCQIDTSKVELFEKMFFNETRINEVSLNEFLVKFNTENGRNFNQMFTDTGNVKKIDISHFHFTNKKGVSLNAMFRGCFNLEELKFSSTKTFAYTFDYANVYNGGPLGAMFENCSKLKTIDLTSFNFHSAFSAQSMFHNCSSLKTIYASVEDEPYNFSSIPEYLLANQDWCAPFAGCTSLVGGNGTKWSNSQISYDFFKVDRAGQKGYFTAK